MKLTSIAINGRRTPAALLSSGTFANLAVASQAGLLGDGPLHDLADIIDLDGPLLDPTRRLVDALESGDRQVMDQLKAAGGLVAGSDAVYAPMLRPGLLYACGMAYRKHMEEMNVAIPKQPAGFMKSPNAIVAHGEAIVLPASEPDMIDYECELACVIGRSFYNASPEEVMDCIVGYTMHNDVGSRGNVTNWLASMGGDNAGLAVGLYVANTLDKQHPSFAPIGPVIETADTFGDPMDFVIESRLNGELVQTGESSDLIFPIAESLSFFSRWFKFNPGDVYSTGSPAGVGFAKEPPRMLQAGDVIEVSCSKIGALSNPVVAEQQ